MSDPRNRISKSNGGISSANDLPRIVAAASPFRLRVSATELHEFITDALIAYDIEVDLMPANRLEIQRQRQQMQAAIERLQRLLSDPLTEELADLLLAYPATLTILGQKPKSDLGALPLRDLRRDLAALQTALTVRVFTDRPQAETRPARCPSFPSLIGALSNAFVASFADADGSQPETGAAFDRFARCALDAAGIKPCNEAPFGERAVTDALGKYRRWQRAT